MTHSPFNPPFRNNAAPSNGLARDEALSLLSKHIRWYGFNDWRVADVKEDQKGYVSVELASDSADVVCIANIDASTGALDYQIKDRAAVARL